MTRLQPRQLFSQEAGATVEFVDYGVKMPKGFTDRVGGEGDWK